MTISSITLNSGQDCFYHTESQSFTDLVSLCTLGPFKTQRLEQELVNFAERYNRSLVCKHMTTFSPLFLVSAQLVNIPLFFRMSLQQTQVNFKLNHRIKLWKLIRIIIDEISLNSCLQSNALSEIPIYHPSLWSNFSRIRRSINNTVYMKSLTSESSQYCAMALKLWGTSTGMISQEFR